MANYGVFANELVPFVNDAIQRATVEAMGYAARQTDAAIAQAVHAVSRATSGQLTEMARVFDQGIAPAERARLHAALGRAGQQSVLSSFDRTKKAKVPGELNRSSASSKYRRYAGGRLRSALADPSFWSADADGLQFINVALLNQRAAQWARLNFGAGGAGSGSKPSVNVTLGTLVIATLGLEEPARPGFRMPVGYWTDAGGTPTGGRGVAFFPYMNGPHRRGSVGGGRFYIDGEGNRARIPMRASKATAGIESRNFLDAGVQRIAREMGPGYQNLYKQLAKNAQVSVRPYRLRMSVRPVR